MSKRVLDSEVEKTRRVEASLTENKFLLDPLRSPIRQRQRALDLVAYLVVIVAWLWRAHWQWVVLGFYILSARVVCCSTSLGLVPSF